MILAVHCSLGPKLEELLCTHLGKAVRLLDANMRDCLIGSVKQVIVHRRSLRPTPLHHLITLVPVCWGATRLLV
jgi:hypothetical protein